jgi:hypothetical protein
MSLMRAVWGRGARSILPLRLDLDKTAPRANHPGDRGTSKTHSGHPRPQCRLELIVRELERAAIRRHQAGRDAHHAAPWPGQVQPPLQKTVALGDRLTGRTRHARQCSGRGLGAAAGRTLAARPAGAPRARLSSAPVSAQNATMRWSSIQS